MAEISELKPGEGNVNVEGTIQEIGETKVFNKFGRELRVADAQLKDSSGSIKLTLWNDDIRNFKTGDKIKVVNGYVNEFQGEKQLTSGKFGKIEKISESGSNSDDKDAVQGNEDVSEEGSEEEESANEENIEEEEF